MGVKFPSTHLNGNATSYNIDLDLSYSDETIGLPSLLGRDILDDWHIEYSRKRNLLRCAI